MNDKELENFPILQHLVNQFIVGGSVNISPLIFVSLLDELEDHYKQNQITYRNDVVKLVLEYLRKNMLTMSENKKRKKEKNQTQYSGYTEGRSLYHPIDTKNQQTLICMDSDIKDSED